MIYNLITREVSSLYLMLFLFISCTQPTQTEKELREVLNTQLNLTMLDAVLHKDSVLSLLSYRGIYEFMSVVYLQDGCNPCYPKFIEWHQKMDSLEAINNHTVLFVIQGDSNIEFMRKVMSLGFVDDRYYTIMDPDFKFLDSNKDIPRWIIDASVLIDSENKIKMVGAPWVNEDMKNLFYKTVKNEQSSVISKQ
jgi:hypothetical protein